MSALTHIEFGLSSLRSRYQQDLGKLGLLREQHSQTETALEAARKDVEAWQQVQILFTKVSEFSRAQLKTRIEETVTAALQAVFMDDNLEFQVDIRTVGGKPTAEWTVISKYGDVVVAANPEDARGGGIVDITSMALRLALLELARPKVQGPVILDEPSKMVSREYLSNFAEFLKRYAVTAGRSIIMVTHAEPLAEVADVSYRVSQKDGISEVSRL